MNSLVSVIIPVYNVEEYLDRCVESLINQTYPYLEIILIDDESPDSCPQKCDKWVAKDSRIQVIHQKNAGPGEARNSGLDIATGEYITFVDPDDYLSLDAIEVMLEQIIHDQSDLIVAQYVRFYPDGNEQPSSYTWLRNDVITKDEAMQMIGIPKRSLPIYFWGKLYKREVFATLRFPSLRRAEDVYAFPHIIDQCGKISITDHVVYYYFQRETSIVHNSTDRQKLDSVFGSLHVARFLLDRNCVEGARGYYQSATAQMNQMKDQSNARKMVEETFNAAERKKLQKKRVKVTFFQIVKRTPGLRDIYMLLKKQK